jgi:PAS domain-containing protein
MAGELGAKVRDAELRRLELEAAFRDISEAIFFTDGAGVITRINPRARQLMGVNGFEPGPGFARSIYEQSARLENLADDLLKISYAESGKASWPGNA